MISVLALKCSPRSGGATDLLAEQFAAGARSAGADVAILALRDYQIAPCVSCGACSRPPYACVLDRPPDGAAEIFRAMQNADLVALASPIFFYALPASFKALIDRGQKFWNRGQNGPEDSLVKQKPVVPILTAGRPRGKLLFSGALLTLKWFLKNLDARIVRVHAFRGIEGADSVSLPMRDEVCESGHELCLVRDK